VSPARVRLVAVTALLLVAVACGDDVQEPEADPTAATTATTPSAAPPSPSGDAGPTLPVEVAVPDAGGESILARPFADFMVAAGEEIWVSGVSPGVVAYGAATGTITHSVTFGSDVVQAMAQDGSTVYAAGAAPDVLLTIDAASGEERDRVDLPASPLPESSVAADRGRAWVLVGPGAPRLLVVEGGEVTGRLPAPEGALAVRFGFGSLWVTVEGGEVARLDPEDGTVGETYSVGLGARFLTVGEDAVWTLDAADGTVSRVDPETGEVAAVLVSDFPIEGGDIAADLGVVWARTSTGVTRVDPATLVATDRIGVARGSGSVAAAAGWMWLSDHDHDAVHRVPVTGLSGS
jgi:virginiamycin B lyase